jgi:NhaA family Na+:H+ antiporter
MSVVEARPVERIVRPFQDFAHKQSSGGILLVAAAVVALVWANSPWAEGYAALSLFALANAGVPLRGGVSEALTNPVVLGIVLGLVVGKQLGVTLFAWLAVKSSVSELPTGVNWRHIYGGGWLAGIGFTVSLFISDLAFSNDELVEIAKLGILAASMIAGVVGWAIARGASAPRANT